MQYIDILKQIINIGKIIEFNSFESSYLMFLDANNLHEWAMSERLPVDGFKWEEKIHKFKFHLTTENSGKMKR